jgi:hypothetical protein
MAPQVAAEAEGVATCDTPQEDAWAAMRKTVIGGVNLFFYSCRPTTAARLRSNEVKLTVRANGTVKNHKTCWTERLQSYKPPSIGSVPPIPGRRGLCRRAE